MIFKTILNYSSWNIYSSYWLNTQGPLCLWQCFFNDCVQEREREDIDLYPAQSIVHVSFNMWKHCVKPLGVPFYYTRFSINGICHFSVNFFVFRLYLKTKSVLKSLCNLPVEFVISKQLVIIFIFLKNKNVVFHCFWP